MTQLPNKEPRAQDRMRFSVRSTAVVALLAMALASCGVKQDPDAAHVDAGASPSVSMGGDPDTRAVILLPVQARHMVLEEMRLMLSSVEGYVAAAAKGDTAGMRLAALASGTAAAADEDPEMEHKLPAEFIRLGMSTHAAWDSLAADVGRGVPRDQALGRLAGIMKDCSACHAQYRIEVQR